MIGTGETKRSKILKVARNPVREIRLYPYKDTKQCRVGKGYYVPK